MQMHTKVHFNYYILKFITLKQLVHPTTPLCPQTNSSETHSMYVFEK